jgi:hypothetical protein
MRRMNERDSIAVALEIVASCNPMLPIRGSQLDSPIHGKTDRLQDFLRRAPRREGRYRFQAIHKRFAVRDESSWQNWGDWFALPFDHRQKFLILANSREFIRGKDHRECIDGSFDSVTHSSKLTFTKSS